jgi:anti-sigma regulatory factor (Ser/Thr protein kinase)
MLFPKIINYEEKYKDETWYDTKFSIRKLKENGQVIKGILEFIKVTVNIKPEQLEDVEIVASEAIDNALIHGPKGQKATIEVYVSDKVIKIKVTDKGSGYNMQEHLEKECRDYEEIRALRLMSKGNAHAGVKLMHDLSGMICNKITDKGHEVTMYFELLNKPEKTEP